jgi:hypothetical protein
MKIVRLKNGAEEADLLVGVVMAHLYDLMDSNPVAFYELVLLCRDPNHKLFGNTPDVLRDSGFVRPDGQVHDSIRNVVLSGVTRDGLDMILGGPVEEGELKDEGC